MPPLRAPTRVTNHPGFPGTEGVSQDVGLSELKLGQAKLNGWSAWPEPCRSDLKEFDVTAGYE